MLVDIPHRIKIPVICNGCGYELRENDHNELYCARSKCDQYNILYAPVTITLRRVEHMPYGYILGKESIK